jgi:hypothetical protein
MPRIEGYWTEFDATTCSLKGAKQIEENCYDEICILVDRHFQLTFGATCATGTVTIARWRDCNEFVSKAPIEATKTQ